MAYYVSLFRMLSAKSIGRRWLVLSHVASRGRPKDPNAANNKPVSPQEYSRMVETGKKKAYYSPKTEDPFWKP